jgi:hypothetical protein
MSTSLIRTWFLDPLTGPLAPTGHAPFIPDDPAVESIDLLAIGSNWSVPELRTLLRDGLGPRGVAVALIRCPPYPFPGFRHPAIRPSEPAPNISPKQGSFASLSPPLLIKPGCLFDEFLDCRLRQFQDGCAEAITQKIKPSLDLADKRFVRVLFEAQGG